MSKLQDNTKKAYALLNLERKMVGIQFFYDKDKFDRIQAIQPVRPMYYCQAVSAAGKGHPIKLTKETSKCKGSSRALGFVPPTPEYFSGEAGKGMGLYETQEVAKSVALRFAVMNRPLYGIVVMPLECFEEEPDVVLFVTNTREAMRIVQGYIYLWPPGKFLHERKPGRLCGMHHLSLYQPVHQSFGILCRNPLPDQLERRRSGCGSGLQQI